MMRIAIPANLEQVVGIVGSGGSGKDTVAAMFEQHGYYHVSSSDTVREEIAARNLKTSRQLQTEVANELREKNGPSYWVEKTLQKVPASIGKVAVSGLYAPGEGIFLQNDLKGCVVGVITTHSEDVLYDRMVARSDGTRDNLNRQQFREANERENSGTALTDTNIATLLSSADFIINNSSDMTHLESETLRVISLIEEKRW